MGNQEQKPQHQETFTCEICIEPVILPNTKFKNSNKCVHPFCTDCIQKYIDHQLQENVSNIKCPAINCDHSLEILSCRPNITNQVFNKWCDVLCESLVLGYSRVYCPNVECSELILDECGDDFDGGLKRCECPKCRNPFCFRCKVPWHGDDDSCKETIDENEAAFVVEYKKNKWKRCPKCGHCIELVSGCNRVICRCGNVFDYKGGREIERYQDDGNHIIFLFCFLLLLCIFLYFLPDILSIFVPSM